MNSTNSLEQDYRNAVSNVFDYACALIEEIETWKAIKQQVDEAGLGKTSLGRMEYEWLDTEESKALLDILAKAGVIQTIVPLGENHLKVVK